MDDDFHKNWFMRHKFLALLLLLALGIIAFAFIYLRPSENKNPYVVNEAEVHQEPTEAELEQEQQPVKAGLGEAAFDGELEITVKGVKCGEKKIGTNEYAHDDAAGVFCRVQTKVKNTSQETLSVPAEKIRLYDSEGKEYKFDSAATVYTQTDLTTSPWFESISGDAVAAGDFVFDVPEKATPAKLLLYGSEDSPGVEFEF